MCPPCALSLWALEDQFGGALINLKYKEDILNGAKIMSQLLVLSCMHPWRKKTELPGVKLQKKKTVNN